ncbi:MAG: 30S ribosomal protein S2 [Candidatus Pacebacteria bacterium]|nr:30S ribosomal protein S2 [Candidatus Paceibacterota bacterium]
MNTVIEKNDALDALFKAGAHYGVAKARRHPSTQKALFGQKQKMDLFDLALTYEKLEEAKEFVRILGRERKTLLFVGGKPESQKIVREVSNRIGAPYCIGRWIGGTITNYAEIKKRVAHMVDLTTRREAGTLTKYTKFERLQIDREIEKLEGMYAGLTSLGDKLPAALFVVDPKREMIAVREAKSHDIPVIALANSDCDLTMIDCPIPANDATAKSIRYIVEEIASAYKEGLEEKLILSATPRA